MSDEKIILYTSNWCGHARTIEQFLHDYEVPVTVVNIDEVPEARAIVKQLNGGYASVPTLLFPDGTQLTEPTIRQVRQKLGLGQKDETLLDRVWGLFSGKE